MTDDLERAREVIARHEALTARLGDPDVLGEPAKLREVAREHSDLGEAAAAAARLVATVSQLEGARELLDTDDDELARLAESEVAELEQRAEDQSETLRRLLVPPDPLADRAAVLEIRAGTGGDEAGLFAGDLFRMYSRFAEQRGWSLDVLNASEGEVGGYKEIIFVVDGRDAYGSLRHESGVHRVQRVPQTESQGRIHTSAATVAVLPEAEDVDVDIRDEDLRIDVFRSSGPGGQSVNTTDSAVRVTHLPTGVVVTCQDEKSQHKNKAKALKVLRSRLLDARIAEQEAERARARRTQVGTGDRSAKIRTYNYPQGRITDHRINLTLYRLSETLDGDLDDLVDALRQARESERLEAGT